MYRSSTGQAPTHPLVCICAIHFKWCRKEECPLSITCPFHDKAQKLPFICRTHYSNYICEKRHTDEIAISEVAESNAESPTARCENFSTPVMNCQFQFQDTPQKLPSSCSSGVGRLLEEGQDFQPSTIRLSSTLSCCKILYNVRYPASCSNFK